ncbi:hypothetical protein BDV18DRAFT_142769 [Aspergillus unguis]
MSDPIPSAAKADPSEAPSTSAEDRKAAAALSSLNTTEIATDSESAGGPGMKQPSSADQEALGKAMSRLEMAAGGAKGNGVTPKTSKNDSGSTGKAEEKKRVAAVKVAAEDVGLLVNELDLSKVKATELLKTNEGDVKKAIRAFIRPQPAAAA